MSCETIFSEYEVITEPRPYPVGNPATPVVFKLRGLTDSEATDIMTIVGKDATYETIRASDRKSIFYSLGGRVQLGEEGVDGAKPVMEKLENLRPEVTMRLVAAVVALTYPKAPEVKN
jgi:hypothetical protein